MGLKGGVAMADLIIYIKILIWGSMSKQTIWLYVTYFRGNINNEVSSSCR